MNEAQANLAKENYLRRGGWLQGNSGWWHPPSCLASWPLDQAVEMAKRDEASGRRMTEQQLREYLREQGIDADEYLKWIQPKGDNVNE